MVTLPPDFVATRHAGYFWHLKEKKLYSLKVGGVLRPLAGPYKPNHFSNFHGYHLSVNGKKRGISLDTLNKLTQSNSVIPVEKK